jgi:hypothetical protein
MALQFRTDQLAAQAVTAAKIANGTITATQLGLGGAFAFTGALTSTNAPTNANDVVNKSYVDNIAAGLHWKDSCRVASTGNLTLSGTQTVDGVALQAGDRILVKAQSTGSQNGVYVVAAGAWSRSSDMDAASEFPGAAMFIREGTVNADSGYVCSNDTVNLGSTAITFVQFTGGASLTGGDGITITGNTISVDLIDSGSGLEFSGGELRIAASAVTNAMLAGSIDDGKLNTITGANKVSGSAVQLAGTNATLVNDSGLKVRLVSNKGLEAVASGLQIKLDGASLALGASGISVAPGGVSNAMLAGSIADSNLLQIATADKVAGSAVQLNATPGLENSTGLRVKLKANTGLQIDGDGLQAKIKASSGLGVDSDGLQVAIKANSGVGVDGSGLLVKLKANNGVGVDSDGLLIIRDGGSLAVGASGLKVADNGIGATQLASNAVGLDQWGVRIYRQNYAGNGSAATFDLSGDLPGAFFDGVMVYRNGQLCKKVASSPADSSEYTVTDSGSATRITFGAAPLSGEVIDAVYFGNAA